MKDKNPLVFDKRLQGKNLRSGLIGQDDLNKYLKNLPDVSEKMEKLVEDKQQEETPSEEEPS